jgi:tetratricopeptide (TPR) repeat protein
MNRAPATVARGVRTGVLAAAVLLGAGRPMAATAPAEEATPVPYAGSTSCRECHEKFYQLWSTSMHGLAMQPYTPEFAKTRLTPQKGALTIDKLTYRADIGKGVVTETGPKGTKSYRIEHVLGGKNVCYFLTTLDKGRLQTLPVAYDLNKKEWFDTAASGVRHFPGGERSQAFGWKDSAYTFNTACYGCHVSQLSTNYDPKTGAYNTTWAEPGINCETCHGSSVEHNKIARATPKGEPLTDLRIIRTKTMTKQQRSDLCASCHAKATPLTLEYPPGARFYDHFELATLEDTDFYPDGRDLGENYTLTSWSMSPCATSGKIDCMHCHTSSGRYRFKKEKFNNACVPCHEGKVNDPAAHTHHLAESEGSRCISCHMPKTAFARMNRSDHSMLPPSPAATIAYQSPNACNLCHGGKDAAWADALVRQWRTRDYQAPLLTRAALVAAARKRDWSKLPEMLAYVGDKGRDEVFATSLIRLLASAADERIAPALLAALKDPSPLVRGAAVDGLALRLNPEIVPALLDATGDEYRLVRVRAAAALTGYPTERLAADARARFEKAEREYLDFIMARPDQWTSHYNLGNYRLGRGETEAAVASFEEALKLEPRSVLTLVNASIAHARAGELDKAEKSLRQALKLAPDNAAANFNMGLVQAEKNAPKEAERYLRAAIKADPQMAQAAYNLCILASKDRIGEAVTWCRKAAELAPQNPTYAYTLAFYLNQKGDRAEAIKTLEALLGRHPGYQDAEMLLGDLLKREKKP